MARTPSASTTSPRLINPGDRLLVDMGSLFGMTVGVTSEDGVAMLTANPSFDYSLAPERPMSIVEHEGSLYVLLHAFWDR